ncbi:hypothetical protein CYMTET_7419, partial [Cymbomonas tetramitiformis]
MLRTFPTRTYGFVGLRGAVASHRIVYVSTEKPNLSYKVKRVQASTSSKNSSKGNRDETAQRGEVLKEGGAYSKYVEPSPAWGEVSRLSSRNQGEAGRRSFSSDARVSGNNSRRGAGGDTGRPRGRDNSRPRDVTAPVITLAKEALKDAQFKTWSESNGTGPDLAVESDALQLIRDGFSNIDVTRWCDVLKRVEGSSGAKAAMFNTLIACYAR